MDAAGPGFVEVGTVATGSLGPLAVSKAPPAGTFEVPAGPFRFSLRPIDSATDGAYRTLYEQAVEGVVNYADFAIAVENLLQARPKPATMDDFFANATGVWQVLLQKQQFQTADGFWWRLLDIVEGAERKLGVAVHKGAGYYYWAANGLLAGNLEDGMVALHRAVEEDRKTEKKDWPPTSAVALATLDAAPLSTHPLSWWVNKQYAFLRVRLEAAKASALVADFRQRLLLAIEPEDLVMFVSGLSGLDRQAERSRPSATNMERQLVASYLLKLAIVLERSIKAKSGNDGQMGEQVKHVSKKLGGKLGTLLGDLNVAMKTDPDATLRSVLDGKFSSGAGKLLDIDRPLALAYLIRNRAAHTTQVPDVLGERVLAVTEQMLLAFDRCIGPLY